MPYYPKKIKDKELPALHFLINEILYNFFDDIYENIKTEGLRKYAEFCDDESNYKSINLESIKKIFRQYEKDYIYRPTYDSINFLVFGLEEKKMSFKSFMTLYKKDIKEYSKRLKYNIYEKNFEPTSEHTKNLSVRKFDLGQASLQIDLSDVFISKLIQNIEPIIGDLVSEGISSQNKIINVSENPRINTRLALKEATRQNNIDNIIGKVISFGNDKEPDNADIEPDWLTEFFNLSQDISNDTMQFIWAKILADEVDSPGSFSRRTLNAVKLIDSDEAKIFTLLCSCLWEMNPDESLFDRVLFKNSNTQGKYSDTTWGFNSELLRHLEDIGLIHETFIVLEKNDLMNLSYRGRNHQIMTRENALEIEVVRLSSIGEQIYEVVKTEPNIEYYKYTLDFLKQEKLLKK